MTKIDTMSEQQVRQYQARLKHFDELFERAEKGAKGEEVSELQRELAALRQEREKLLDHIEQLKRKTREEWQEESFEQAGPMILWEAVAKRLEKLVERLEGKKVKM